MGRHYDRNVKSFFGRERYPVKKLTVCVLTVMLFSCRIDSPVPFPGEGTVRLSDGSVFLNIVAAEECGALFRNGEGWRVADSFYSGGHYFYHLSVPEESASEAVRVLRRLPSVRAADFDTVLEIKEESSEPLLPAFYASQMCRLEELHNDEGLKRSNRVAAVIVDSGINPLHEELKNVFRAGWSAFSRSAGGNYTYLMDDLSTNREAVWEKITDTVSWDAVTGTAHGTAVASVLGGDGRNGKGFGGVVPDMLDIYVIKAFASNPSGASVSGSGSSWALYSGLQRYICGYSSAEFEEENPVSWKEWTQKSGIPYRQKVLPVNISVGASVASGFEMFVLKKLWENDAVVIASSGNEGLSTVCYPSAYSFVLSVGAVDAAGVRPRFSNYGDCLDLTAPGVSIPVADGTGISGYRWNDGTSFSAPFVTGVASWMLGVNPNLSRQQLFSILKSSVIRPETVPFYNGFHSEYGAGIIDARQAVVSAKNSDVPVMISTADLTVVVKENVVTQSGSFFFYLYNDKNRLTAAHPAGTDGTVFFGALEEGKYRLEIQVPDGVGKIEPSFMSISVLSDRIEVDGFASGETPVFNVTYR